MEGEILDTARKLNNEKSPLDMYQAKFVKLAFFHET